MALPCAVSPTLVWFGHSEQAPVPVRCGESQDFLEEVTPSGHPMGTGMGIPDGRNGTCHGGGQSGEEPMVRNRLR